MAITRGKKPGAQPVEAGILTSALSKLLGGAIDRVFKNIEKAKDERIKKVEPDGEPDKKTGAVVYKIATGNGYIFKMQMTPVKPEEGGESDADFDETEEWSKNPIFRLHFKGTGIDGKPKDKVFDAVKEADVPKRITDICEEWYEGGAESAENQEGEDLMSSRKLRVTLCRVVGSEQDSIALQAVTASYDPTEALADLNAVMDNPDFIAEVTESPTSYEISTQGDELNVERCNEGCGECSTDEAYKAIMRKAFEMEANIQYMSWNARGNKLFRLRDIIDCEKWRAQDLVRSLATEMMKDCGYVPNPLSLLSDLSYVSNDGGVTFNEAIIQVMDLLQKVKDAITLYACNFHESLQRTLDDYVSYIDIQISNVYKRALMD